MFSTGLNSAFADWRVFAPPTDRGHGGGARRPDATAVDIKDRLLSDPEFFDSFYARFEGSFPDESERHSPSEVLALLKRPNWHFYGYLLGDEILAGWVSTERDILFEDSTSPEKVSFMEYFFVDSSLRGQNFGSRLYSDYLKACEARGVDIVIGEVKGDIGIRIFWERQGWQRLDFTYHQPALRAGANSLPDIALAAHAVSERGKEILDHGLCRCEIEQLVGAYYSCFLLDVDPSYSVQHVMKAISYDHRAKLIPLVPKPES